MSTDHKPMMWPYAQDDRSDDDWELYPEAIRAWRAWRVIDYEGVFLLRSITYNSDWIPRQEMIACCIPGPIPSKRPVTDHPAPDIDHGCGIYSLKEESDATIWMNHVSPAKAAVYGSVSIWGHVFKFTKGYLSEFAYPSHLVIPHHIGQLEDVISPEELSLELSKTYQVEAVMMSDAPCS